MTYCFNCRRLRPVDWQTARILEPWECAERYGGPGEYPEGPGLPIRSALLGCQHRKDFVVSARRRVGWRPVTAT